MNTNLLKKCIQELEKDKPNIDYLRGMLETLYEMQVPSAGSAGSNPIKTQPNLRTVFPSSNPAMPTSEADVLNAEAAARLKGIKDVAIEV